MNEQRIFEVGDKVRSPLWKGVAIVADREEDSALIAVKDPISTGIYHWFESSGIRYGEYEPSLRHAETGIPARVGEPPERFEYPLYMNSGHYTVEFTGLTVGTVVVSDAGGPDVGYYFNSWLKHTDRSVWTPCEKSVWKPTKPTWCWVWDDYNQTKRRLMVVPHKDPDKFFAIAGGGSILFDNAEPCEAKDIPDYWPEEWT